MASILCQNNNASYSAQLVQSHTKLKSQLLIELVQPFVPAKSQKKLLKMYHKGKSFKDFIARTFKPEYKGVKACPFNFITKVGF